MVRKGKQIQVRLRRIELANRLLEWSWAALPCLLVEGKLEGSHIHERVIIPFTEREETDVFEVWKAWDILKESGRRAVSRGGHFTIVCVDPIKADQFGNIISV